MNEQVNIVIDAAAAAFGTTPDKIRGDRRGNVAEADAKIAVYAVLRELGHGPSAIGVLFGRDHSSIIKTAAKAAPRAAVDPVFARRLERVRLSAQRGPDKLTAAHRLLRRCLPCVPDSLRAEIRLLLGEMS